MLSHGSTPPRAVDVVPADIVFHETVPGLLDLLPRDLRRTVEDIAPAPTKGLLDLTARLLIDPGDVFVICSDGVGSALNSDDVVLSVGDFGCQLIEGL